MIAVDTNVLIRLLADDDPAQSLMARQFVEKNDIFLSLLSIVECEWVLRSGYRWQTDQIADALEALMLAPGVSVELADSAAWALARFRGGADIADMMLLIASRDTQAFASFDKRLAKQAGPNSPIPIKDLNG